jgi:hypothetical protein
MELFIVVYRFTASSRWIALCEGEHTEYRLAQNQIEIKKAQRSTWEFGIVGGPIVQPLDREA